MTRLLILIVLFVGIAEISNKLTIIIHLLEAMK
jgi:hypothetical protein